MNNFSQFIAEPNASQTADVNEVVGVLFASACLAYACTPILEGFGKAIGETLPKAWDFFEARAERRRKKREEREQRNQEQEQINQEREENDQSSQNERNIEIFNSLLMIARKSNQKEKDVNTKKKNDAMLKLLVACSFDKDGNEIPLEERIDKMKDTMSPEQFEAFKNDMTKIYEENKNNQDFKDALVNAKNNIKPNEYDEMLNKAKEEAKTTLKQIEEEKLEIEEYEQKIQDIEDEINGSDEKDKEIRELKKQVEELKNNPPQTLTTIVSGVNVGEPKTDTKKQELQAAMDKEMKSLKATIDKKKGGDSDNDVDTKQGKYKVQDEEIENPKTGKKIKIKTYTGPRGGKFYYPKGKPKTPENKVYIQESISLQDYLLEFLM